MKIFLGGTVTVALALASCGGNVVVDSPGATGGTTTTSSTTHTTTSGTTPTVTVTVGVSSSGGTCSPSCNQTLNNGGPAPCSTTVALMAYGTLLGCACTSTSACAMSCTSNFCLHVAASSPCRSCLQASCGSAFMTCEAN
jgi:hypothetical protein